MSWRSGYGHTGRVFDVKLSPAGNCLLSASEDGSARVWSLDSETITQKACAAGHTAEVMHMRASWKHDQTMIATGAQSLSASGTPGCTETVECNREYCCAGSADTTAMIWRLQEEYASKCIAVLEGHAEELYCCEWVRNSEHVVTASGSDIMLWDISRQRRIAQAMLRSPSVHSTSHTRTTAVLLSDCTGPSFNCAVATTWPQQWCPSQHVSIWEAWIAHHT